MCFLLQFNLHFTIAFLYLYKAVFEDTYKVYQTMKPWPSPLPSIKGTNTLILNTFIQYIFMYIYYFIISSKCFQTSKSKQFWKWVVFHWKRTFLLPSINWFLKVVLEGCNTNYILLLRYSRLTTLRMSFLK